MTEVRNSSRRILPIPDAIHALQPNATWRIEGDGLEGLVWESDPTLRPTDEAILAKAEELLSAAPMRVLRRVRDARMREVDWVVIRAMRTGEEISQEWRDYFQALADITKTATPRLESGELLGVDWPIRPDGEPAGHARYRHLR